MNASEAPPDDDALERLAAALGHRLRTLGATITTAESCTGGWIAKVLTDVAGSSAWFGTGFVTYSNAAKEALLGVPTDVLARHGAVSEPVVARMARGARSASGASHAVAVSGVAGPDGGTPGKPVGLVWFAWERPEGGITGWCRFAGDREAVRRFSVAHALRGVLPPGG